MEVQMSIKNSTDELRRVTAAMQEQFKNIDLSTPFGKQYSKIISQIQKGFANIDASTLGSELFDESDFKRVAGYVEKIDIALQNLRVHGASGTARQLGLDITAIEEAEEKLKKLKKAKEDYAKTSVGELAPAELLEFEKHKKGTGFSASKTYKSNIHTLASKRGVVKQQLDELENDANKQAREKAREEASKLVDAAEEQRKQAEDLYNQAVSQRELAETELKNSKAKKEAAEAELARLEQGPSKFTIDIAKKFNSVPGTKKGRNKSDVAESFGTMFEEEANSYIEQGKFNDQGKTFVRTVAQWLNYSEEDITKLMRRRTDNIVKQLKESLEDSVNNNMYGITRITGPIEEEYSLAQDAVISAEKHVRESQDNLNTATDRETNTEATLASATAAKDAAEEELKKVTKIYDDTVALVQVLDKQIETLSRLSQEFDASVGDKFNEDINQAAKDVTEASDAALQEIRAALTTGAGESNTLNKDIRSSQRGFTEQQDELKRISDERERAEKAAAQEAADFKKNLSSSIGHWMSAQQIINIIKDGIRQAYQDIKALDKSMTDIAVVTDMSISDLWGKINDYMAIAQQYGVTTQGVYEVSQLYYQQGLATNEVMAATTETLKLARIAGMDYKDAADAMTVAIRAFKMEMEDANHVTDVYSKVAAITASDSEELAVAMSKTASSAESVGSSFENTTAMLAVMVETTRESAQNLGSALKSIISRYGEMKVGLTVDSEGEEIDYNKVDTALKSVGISIKDAQGQFRDFDDVIFELSKKWDSLDKNTQRYIATIMAGNRQQSRFIALVDNWERLDEVSKAAADSTDAGLLQYAKTLDSLETKLNQLSNTFQAFYMEIINGEVVKGFVDILNNAVTSFARLGPIIGGLKLVKLISQIKQIGTLLVNTFSSGIQKVRNASKDWQDGFTKGWPSVGDKIGDFIANGIKNGAKKGVAEATDAALAKTSAGATAQFIQSSPTNEASLLAKKELGTSVLNSYFSQVASIDQSTAEGKAFYNAVLAASDRWTQTNADLTIEEMAALTQRIGETEVAYRKLNNEQVGAAKDASEELKKGAQEAGQSIANSDSQKTGFWSKIKNNRYGIGQVLTGVGTVGSLVSSLLPTDTMAGYDAQGWVNAGSGLASTIGQALTGNYVEAAISAITTVTEAITHFGNRAKVELENAQKAAENANIERAQKKEEYKNLQNYTDKLKELEKTRFESEESQEEWIALNNEMAEKYPELISYIDSAGNSIVDLEAATVKLTKAQDEALRANQEYWAAEREAQQKGLNSIGNTAFTNISNVSGLYTEKIDPVQVQADVLESNTTTRERLDLTQSFKTHYKNKNELDAGELVVAIPVEGGGYQYKIIDAEGNDVLNNDGFKTNYNDFIIEQNRAWTGVVTDQQYNASYIAGTHKSVVDEQAYAEFFTDPNKLNGQSAYDVFGQLISEGTIKDLATSGLNLAQIMTTMDAEGNQDFKDNMMLTGLFVTDENGDTDLSETGKQIAQYQKNFNLYLKSVKSFISSTGNLILQGTSSLKTISDISGWEELALINATSTDDDWLNMTADEAETSYQEFAKELADWYSGLSENYQKTFNNILNNINAYSTEDLEKELRQLGLEGTAIWDAVMLKYAESRVNSVERWAKLTKGDGAVSLEQFKADNRDQNWSDEEAAAAYVEEYGKEIKKLSTQELDAHIDRQYKLTEQIADNSPLKAVFEAQNDLLERALKLWQDSDLADEARNELYDIINAEDFGTVDWSKRVTEWNTKWGARYDNLTTDAANIISESFFTYVDGLLDEIETTLDSFEDIVNKQSKGFTFEEARKLLQRYQKLDGNADATFDDIFEILEDGTIVLREFDTVVNAFYAEQVQDIQEQSQQIQTAIDGINQEISRYSPEQIKEYKLDNLADWDELELESWLMISDINPTMINTIMTEIADGTIETWNDVIDFLSRTQEELDAGLEYYQKQIYKAKFDNWKNTKYNKAQDITFDLIGSSWAEDYQKQGGNLEDTAAFNQFMEGKLAEIDGAFVDASSNLIITNTNAFIDYLSSTGLVDESTLQAYTAQIEDATIETVTSIFDLITKAIEGTLTATELVSLGEKMVNSGRMSAEAWSDFAQSNISRVGTGYKMNEAAAFALQVNAGNYDFEDLVDQFDSLDEVNDMLKELQDNSEQFGEAFADAAERVLESIKMIKAQDPSDAMFNWMDQDMEGWAGTYESTLNSIGKFGAAIEQAAEDGTMGLQDFYNISQLMSQRLSGEDLLAWEKYRDAVYATATTVDGGTVNVTASAEGMTDALGLMSKTTEEYYQEIAKQQIEYIDSQIAALKAQKKVEEALSSGKDVDREDLIYTGISGDIGLYGKEEYEAAEKQWLTKEGNEGETPESFAATISQYLYEATQDAIIAGLDTTTAQVQQQIKETAMARAGIKNYSDLFADENLQVLTTISQDVATIRDDIISKDNEASTIDPVTGIIHNSTGSGQEEYGKAPISDKVVLTYFDKAIEKYDSNKSINTGKLDADAANEISTYMTKVLGDLDWQSILANSDTTVGGTNYTSSEIYAMNFAQQSIPATIEIADTSTYAQAEALNTIEAFQATLDDNLTHIHIGGDTSGAWTAVQRLISRINNQLATLNVKINVQPTTVAVNGGGTLNFEEKAIDIGSNQATGNVSGLAFATGTEKLIAGAHLANKSLVGELGPELAVYNGQYHLLGANGAEFANIPSDAIIFNHKQTEGILKGQANIRGRVKNGGEAFAEGNISGPAHASGNNYDAAIAALLEARAMWESMLGKTVSELVGVASSGGGSVAQAYSEELQEWYNLLRQIADLEAKINKLVSERNILEKQYNGEATLRNLREQQTLLEKQKTTKTILLKYQNAQLDRQAQEIANDKILSQFLIVEDGVLQYKNGNEANGGKGALEILTELNKMSAADQLSYVKSLGFENEDAAKDQDGNLLEGDDLVQAFYDYINSAIDEYDGLKDSVDSTTSELDDIESDLLDIEDTIRNNQLELEQNIYDTIVDAWEASIEALEEQKDLIEEVNDAYVEGLRDALNAERDAYNDDKAIADREQLQRQLSLLRRTGGSASEIADLEEQLDEKLKEEYFDKQEEMVESIEESNARQVELLEEQIKIQEDTLEYQKANGIIWTKVAEIMDGTKEQILAFLQGNTPGFFSQSKEQQINALNEWSYSIGLFKENQSVESHSNDFSNGIIGEDPQDGTGGTDIWSSEHLGQYKDTYATLDDSQKAAVNNAYGTAYASAIAEGKTEEEARNAGFEAAAGLLKKYKEEKETDSKIADNTSSTDNSDNGGGGGGESTGGGSGSVSITVIAADGLGSPTVNGQTSLKIEPNKTYTIAPNPKPGYEFKERQVGSASIKTTKTFSVSGKYPSLQVKVWYTKSVDTGAGEGDASGVTVPQHGVRIATQDGTVVYDTGKILYSKTGSMMDSKIESLKKEFAAKYPVSEGYQYYAYKTGGLVDYTGLAMVHGTPGKPEAFLNAEQTEAFSEIMGASGKTSLLENIKNTLQTLEASIQGTVSSGNALASNSSIVINPGAVVIEVAELSDSYDVESLSNDVMNRLTAIAAKATSRSVNRR